VENRAVNNVVAEAADVSIAPAAIVGVSAADPAATADVAVTVANAAKDPVPAAAAPLKAPPISNSKN
jgi:hypothetical protein